jgi:hypothetical protein
MWTHTFDGRPIVVMNVITSGGRRLALAGDVRWQLGIQLLDVVDVTEATPEGTLEVGARTMREHVDEYGARAARDVCCYRTGVSGAFMPTHGVCVAMQVAVELRPAETAKEQIRQLDEGEARLAW